MLVVFLATGLITYEQLDSAEAKRFQLLLIWTFLRLSIIFTISLPNSEELQDENEKLEKTSLR